MDEKIKQFIFLMLSTAIVLVIIWGANLFGIKNYSVMALALLVAPVLFGYLLLEYAHTEKIAPLYLYPAYAIIVILAWLCGSISLGAQLIGPSISTLMSLMLLVPLVSRISREYVIKK